jgi:hypothetical protein
MVVRAERVDEAEARDEVLHVAACDQEASALVSDARRRRVRRMTQFGLQPECAGVCQLAHQRETGTSLELYPV